MRAVLLCLTSTFAASFTACGQVRSDDSAAPPRFPVAAPERKDVTVAREYVASISAVRHAELRARVKGVLEAVSVDEGQVVKQGQILFAVNAQALQQEVQVARAAIGAAQAELKAAELERQSTQLLQAKNVVSPAELALAESKVETLRAKVAEAKAGAERAAVELDYARVKAPFDGVVNRVPRKRGSAVAEDELLTTVTDNREVFAYFRLSEREALEVAASGAGLAAWPAVSLKLADGSAFAGAGAIDAVASEIDRETGTLAYRARFANPSGALKHGSSGKIVVTTELPNALVVPQRATFDVQGDLYVYVLDGEVARARKLGVAARLADAFVVDKGLAAGERFVLEGVQKLKDGARIEAMAPTAAAPLAAAQGG